MQTFQEIPLKDITPCPLNPRKNFAGPKFDDLVASIQEKGVIEPVIVRPLPGKKAFFELVAGERRFRAASDCKLETIPAIIRELTDDEAYDFMLIENLHREDLTELEEAESFKAYVGRSGQVAGAIMILAEKTGISPRYIRARIQVLSLPKDVLAMWKDGKLKYGHLEQLLRVDDPGVRGELVKLLKPQPGWKKIETVADLRKEIDELQINLSEARFDAKAECAGCRNNSSVQKDMFGLGDGKAACSNPGCFRARQGDWFKKNWETTSFRREHKTRGFIFKGEVDYQHRKDFNDWNGADKPYKECFACEKFVTSLHVNGKVEDKQVCLDPVCYKRIEAGAKAKKAGKAAAGAPRAAWHGEYFRDHFYRPRIEAKIKELSFTVTDGLAVLLAAIAGQNHVDTLPAVLAGKKGRYGFYNRSEAVKEILSAKADVLFNAAHAIIADFVMKGQSVEGGYADHFGTKDRAALGLFLGIDLAKEYAVNEEYLQKKTTAEILAFIKKHSLAKNPAFQKALKGQVPEKSKKSELVKAVLAIGADLVGKVPDEILNVEKGKKERAA